MADSNIEPLFGPSAPCARNPKAWFELEKNLEAVISNRASVKRKQEAASPIVHDFCAHCPITAECYETAPSGDGRGEKTEFTGIAGGALFKDGEESVPSFVLADDTHTWRHTRGRWVSQPKPARPATQARSA
ncbi:hypothetical protein [Mycobacterium hubeiense]|uniref:hypothetical protein n=1 Tax=Mycobacterium hubeiense TaxID=1867256 RepID=UPI00115788F0|nr:hypothetical protein [Mycobacterium sp. QGD 101]